MSAEPQALMNHRRQQGMEGARAGTEGDSEPGIKGQLKWNSPF